MFRYFLLSFFPLLWLSASSVTTLQTTVAVEKAFYLKSSKAIFNDELGYTHKALLDCSPSIDAVYKVESPQQIKVIPKKQLHTSTTYICHYKKEKFRFKTTHFKLLDAHYFEYEKNLRLEFNDDIDTSTIHKGISLRKINKFAKSKLKYKVLEQKGHTLLLKLTENLGQNSLQLRINRAVKTIYGKRFHKRHKALFHEKNREVVLDGNKKALILHDAPQMVALKNGQFALRLFLEDNLQANAQNFIAIEGIDNVQLKEGKYLEYYEREKYGLKDAYYYQDLTSDEFQPNTQYKIRLQKGLANYYRELKKDIVYELKTANRAKSIVFEKDKPYISNKGEFGFSSINIQKATLVVERLLTDNIRYFMNFNSAKTDKVKPYSQEVFSKEIIFENKPNTILQQKFFLSDLHKGQLPVGVYKLTLRFTEQKREEDKPKEQSSSKVLFLSDLGISANVGKKEAFISVRSLSQATTVANAQVELYGANNALLGTATTNQEGIAIIKKANLLEKKPKGIIVRKANDSNFLALNKSISSPSPSEILKSPERFKAFVYFQSNIVRPASKIHALITVKDRDFISASKLPIKLVFKELYGKVLKEKVYHTDSYGLIDFNYQLSNLDKTGNYILLASIGDTSIGNKKLKVEAFIPPKIENHIKTNKEIYRDNELIEANISSAYLFGAPASKLKGKVTLNARPIEYTHPNYKNYSFSNHLLKQKNVNNYIDYSENIQLNKEGKVEMAITTHLRQKVPSVLEAMIGVTIMDDAQAVSNYKKIKIYPYSAMVGLKLESDSFEKGETLNGKAILIDPLTGKEISRKLSAVIKRIRWHYSYVNDHYNWEKETTIVDTFEINANEKFSYKTMENGDHILEIHDRLGGHSASASFDVWWWSYSNISPSNDLKSVEISFEDKLYKKGDTLEVKIKSPILEGEALLTLESEQVETYRSVKIHKGVAKVMLPIDREMKRGLYLHVTAFRATDFDSKLIPFRAMGYKLVKADRNQHKIKIEMNIPKVSRSKRVLSLRIKTDKASKVLLSVVDRGILQLVNQKKPKIFDYFNESPEQKLSYYDLYDQLLAHITQGKLIDFGAGDMLKKKQKHLAPDLGKRIKPFMLWSGIKETVEGEAEFTIDIPEFNGRVAVLVMAINKNSIGVREEDLAIKDDLMIKPSYPKYTLVGDRLSIPVRIFNTTKQSKTIALTVKHSKNLSFDLNQSTLRIAPKSSLLIQAQLVTNRVGKGEITLIATEGQNFVEKSVELPIFSPYAISTQTFKGVSDKTQTFSVSEEYEGAELYLTLSNNLIGALRNDLKYLISYPYGCAEQTSSRVSAMHYAKPFLQKDKLISDNKHFILEGIKKLENMQNYYGEFSYWKGGKKVHAYASLYAGQILLELAHDGGEIKKSFEKRIITMLKSVAKANGQYSGDYSHFHRLYAGFILAEHKALTQSTSNMLYQQGIYKNNTLATLYMSAILKMQGERSKAKRLFVHNDFNLERYAYKTYSKKSNNFESSTRDMFLHFMIKSQYFKKDDDDLELIQKEFDNLYSTQTKAVALKAVSLYLGQPSSSKLNVKVTLNGESKQYTKPTLIYKKVLNEKSIIIEPQSNAMSYAVELVKPLPRPLKNELQHGEKLSIRRTFINKRGEKLALNKLVQGEKLYAKIDIRNIGAIPHLVINQRIPSCLTIVNNNIKNQKPDFKNENIHQEHQEIRDDRVLNFIDLHNKKRYNRSLKKYISIKNQGTLYVPLLATTVGECKLPAIIAEDMYDARVNDYAQEQENVKVLAMGSQKVKNSVLQEALSLEEKAQSIVKAFYTKEMKSNNPAEFLEFFHFPIETYFRKANRSKKDILKDKSSYFKLWSKRDYNHIKTEVLQSNQDEVQVKITFHYAINNGKKTLEGRSKHILTLRKIKGELLIVKVEI